MQDNNGGFLQYVTQFFCWMTATYSYMESMTFDQWGVVLGVFMSLVFGLWGAWQQWRRTKLEEERTEIIRQRYAKGGSSEPEI